MSLFSVLRNLLLGRPVDPDAIAAAQTLAEPWQERVRRVELPEAERQAVQNLAGGKVAAPALDLDALITERVVRTGLCKGRESDIRFYIDAYHAGRLNGRDLRKHGTPITAQQKRDLGISYRGILTEEFLDTLNDAGLADPEQAAWTITSSSSCAISNAANLVAISEMGLYAEFNASNMAAGPCPRSAKVDGMRYRPEKAPIPPFEDCGHVDQCACMYRATLTLRGEL